MVRLDDGLTFGKRNGARDDSTHTVELVQHTSFLEFAHELLGDEQHCVARDGNVFLWTIERARQVHVVVQAKRLSQGSTALGTGIGKKNRCASSTSQTPIGHAMRSTLRVTGGPPHIEKGGVVAGRYRWDKGRSWSTRSPRNCDLRQLAMSMLLPLTMTRACSTSARGSCAVSEILRDMTNFKKTQLQDMFG